MYSAGKGKMYGAAYNKPVIVVYYNDYSESPIEKSVFNETRYFNDNDKSIVLSDTYKKYKLLDYIYKLRSRS